MNLPKIRFPNYKTIGFWALIFAIMVWFSQISFHLFHLTAELFSIVVACGIFMVAWNTRRFSQNTYLLFVGLAYLFVGCIDLLHTITYKGLDIIPDLGSDPPIQFWIAGRYLEAGSLLAACWFINRDFSPVLMLRIYLIISAALVAAIFGGVFPSCYQDGLGVTTFKTVSELIISLIILAAIYCLWRKRDRFNQDMLTYMYWAMALTIVAELSFSFYITLFGLFNQLGHYFKILSFYLIYKATIQTSLDQPYEGFFRDLKLNQEKLEQSQARLHAIFLSLPIPALLWRHNGNQVTLQDYNQAALNLSNNMIADWKGKGAETFFKNNPNILNDFLQCLDTKECSIKESPYRSVTTGQDFIMELSLVHVPPDMILSLFHDITDRKRTESLRDDVERMTRHDLKTPLSAIIHLPRALEEQLDLNEEQTRILNMISDSGETMLGIIESYMQIFRVETGRGQLDLSPVNLLDLLYKVQADLADLAQEKDLNLLIGHNGDEQEGVYVQGDQPLLYTLFANLLKNAIEASPKSGWVHMNLEANQLNYLVDIHNQGAVPEEIKQRFFDKYVTSSKPQGSGLGTYAAGLIAKAHGGEIELQAGDKDTRLLVSLPKYNTPE